MSNKTLFEVHTFTFCDGWTNCWSISDERGDRPETFPTYALAEAEINDFLVEIQIQIEAGERDPDDGYDRSEYQIVEIPFDKYQ